LTNLIFLASKLEVPTLNIIWSFLHDRDIKDMSKIVTKQKYLNFDRRKTLRKRTITFNFRIIDGHIEFPYSRLFFDKSNKRSIKLETAVTWSKSNLNMMNIYEESTINFWIWPRPLQTGVHDPTKIEWKPEVYQHRHNRHVVHNSTNLEI
jgi:hypothetical protein